MPLPPVPPSLFNAHALATAVDEPHVQSGNHLRVNAHTLLGLPVAPFIIWRAVARGGRGVKFRDAGIFVDSRGRVLAPPFTLTPDNPVTAYILLAPGQTCIWARVNADPLGGSAPTPGTGPVIGPPTSVRERLGSVRLDGGRRAADLLTALARSSGMTAEASVSSARGPAPVGRRDAPPFAFGAPGIIQVRLTGSAAVAGLIWLESRDLPRSDFAPWAILHLPHLGGPRYLSVDGAVARATLQVLNQAPKRRPLQETLGAVAPAAAPPEGPAFEATRVGSLALPLLPELDRLITDLSQTPFEQRIALPVTDETGDRIGTTDQSRLEQVYQGQFDPGCAAFFGYKARDRDFVERENTLVFYWTAGFFRAFPPVPGQPARDPAFDAQLAQLDAENRIGTRDALLRTVQSLMEGIEGASLNEGTAGELERREDYIGLGALAVADRSAPLLPVDAPRIDGSLHVGWLPDVPPAAKREVQVDVSGVVTGGLLAAEKQTPAAGAARAQLNKVNGAGFHLPLMLGLNVDDETLQPADEPGTGFLADRDAAPAPVRYFVAQQDRFGRWSGWRAVVSNPGPRPGPPRPVIRATYALPANPAATGGTVRVQVDVPALTTLAPGGFPIRELVLTGTDLTISAVQTRIESVGNPLAPAAALDFTFAGPLLSPTEQRKLRLVAVWRDTASTASAESEPQTLTMNDPRPPAQLTVPDVLLYSGRPDVTGLSMVEHEWLPLAGQASFAVYYTDENRLTAHLAAQAAGTPEAALLAQLNAAADPAARATLYRANPGLFGAHLFERLDGAASDAPGGKKTFCHAMSGSLRVLSLYRISAESGSAARVDVATLPLLIYAVPNADPPARPVIEVVPADMADNGGAYAVTVRIALTPGVTEAASWRLRRSNLGATDALRMPVVATGIMGALGADGRQRAEVPDAGPVVISATARLQPWVRYHWVAEVQGAPAPGSAAAGRPVPGAWSQPSDPASVILLPPAPPEPAAMLAAAGTALGGGLFSHVVVGFTHPRALSGGVSGSYRARLLRRLPDAQMEALSETPVAGAGPFTLDGMRPGDPADEAETGTLYRIVLVDPIGRESDPAEIVLN